LAVVTLAQATIQAHWRSSVRNPAAFVQPALVVSEIEDRYRVRLPDDFKAYMLKSAPQDDFWDAEDVIWWSPSRIKNIPDEYPHPVSDLSIADAAATCLFFADYMIWCWAWVVCCDEGPNRGKVAVVGGSPDRWIADSFTDFVERYVRDPAIAYE
jgi:hypothetical protein